MGTNGLLERAARLRGDLDAEPAGALSSAEGDSDLDADLGKDSSINAQDRREILATIDKVANANRLSAGPETFVLKPRRRGILFPLLVNVLALSFTAAAVMGLKIVSERREAEVRQSGTVVATAEGKLIQELKRESDSQLKEKDKAIAEIQGRLVALDKERLDLASSIEERVRRREAELRAEMAAELEKERQRLIEQGFSEAAIQERLKRFEAEKTAAFRRELAAFQKAAQAEKDAADARYAKLREEYQVSISSLADERKRIQDEAKRREADLRSSLEAKEKELESQSAEAKASLERAKAELSRLEEQRDRDAAVEDRILGLYGTVRAALRDRRFEDAVQGASALSAYLNDPAVAQAPSLQSRRQTDLFVAEALGSLARSELARTGADATKLLRQAELLSSARDASSAADKALRAGDAATAEVKYREALEKVPEILAAHEFFLARLRDEEAVKRARLTDALSLAEAAYRSGDVAAASSQYEKALEYLPIDEASRREIASRLGQTSAASSDKARRDADTKAAREPMAAARRDLAASKWPESIKGYVAVLAAYPAADQAPEALRGVSSALGGMERSAAAAAEASSNEAAGLRADMERLKAESDKSIAALTVERSRLVAESGDKDARIAKLEKLLGTAQDGSAQAAAQASAATPAAAEAARAGDVAALRAEADRLALVAAKYDRIASAYADYAAAEDAALAAGGQQALVEAHTKLEAFLDGEDASQAMPGLRDRIARYERAYQDVGQREVLYNALDLVDGAVRAKDSASRDRYFRDLEARYASAPAMLDFLRGLRKSIR